MYIWYICDIILIKWNARNSYESVKSFKKKLYLSKKVSKKNHDNKTMEM